MTAEECVRSYSDDSRDTWDFSIRSQEEFSSVTLQMKRGTRAKVDITSVRSYKEDDDLVVEVEFRGDPEGLPSCEVYFVNRSFEMPSLEYELGLKSKYFPDIFFPIDVILSTDYDANGETWWIEPETDGYIIRFREDLFMVEWDGLEPDFEIFVIAVDGETSLSVYDASGDLHWDYAGYGVTEPTLIGPDSITIENDDDREIVGPDPLPLGLTRDQIATIGVVSVVLFIVILITVLVLIVRSSSKRRKKLLSLE
jgi:hypothetical protein